MHAGASVAFMTAVRVTAAAVAGENVLTASMTWMDDSLGVMYCPVVYEA